MSKEVFNRLCRELSPHISKRDTNYRKAITVRHRVAITLYWLADTAHFRTIGNLFGVGKSTVCGIVRQVCEVIVNVPYGRPSPPKIQGCQIDQLIQSWFKDQLQDRIANKGMAWPNYRRFSFPS